MTKVIQHTINTPYVVGPVHCYTVCLEGELILFDTGPETLEARRYLVEKVNLAQLKHVVITHCHIDHYGQAQWLEKNSDATVYIPYQDYLKIAEHERRMREMYHLLSELGFDEKYLEDLRRVFESGELFPPFPERCKIAEFDLPPELGITVLPCPGHSQSDLVYMAEDWAITGDTLLRGISQSPLLDIDLKNGGRFKNYREYCATLVKLSSLTGKRIFPAHRRTVASISSTLKFNVTKLLLRAQQLRPLLDEKNLMAQVYGLLNGKIPDAFYTYLKVSEIVFLKDFLAQPELLGESLREIGLFDGVAELYYAACPQSDIIAH